VRIGAGAPARIDRAAGGIAADAVLYAASAVFAGLTSRNVGLPSHGAWGRMAVWGYLAATLVAVAQLLVRRFGPAGPAGPAGSGRSVARLAGAGSRAVLTGVTFAATALFPLVVEAWQRAGGRLDRAQDEVLTIEAGGLRLWHTGTPYLSHQAIAALPPADRLDGYLPYQPAIALFGLPRAWFGAHWWTDARVWFAVALIVTVSVALMLLRAAPAGLRIRAAQVVLVLPICTLTLATGGDDMVILGLCLLAFAYAARDRFLAAGIVIGVAGAMKLFAWPVALVLLALVVGRAARGAGARSSDAAPGRWGTAAAYAAGAIGLPILVLVPAFAVNRDAAIENVIRFPLGHGLVKSPAASPFPGHLLADDVPAGGTIATALLLLAALAIGVWLIRRPPPDAGAAATVSAWGLLVAILLIPATRFGYLLYPAAYAVWAPALRRADRSTADAEPEAG